MTTSMNAVLKHLHHLLAPPGGDRTDGELLARFVADRDEDSFAALVRRHGPMVLSVCRRMLHHVQDAEDCFQATFLVLARKAATVKREAVGSWLYAVAYRTALEARAVNARQRARERQVQEMPQPEVRPPEIQDWRPWLDQELNRLPEKYRAAIVTCDLEGRSRKEAARLLGLSEGTLSSRLARGRRLLAKRLTPYGLSLPSAALSAALGSSTASAQVPAALLSSTTKAAVLAAAGEFAALSASSAMLMKGVMKSMLATKLKLTLGAVMIVTALGASGLVYRASGQPASPADKRNDGKPRSELERLRHENELLKLNLEVVLEKVRAQEVELRTFRARTKGNNARVVTEDALKEIVIVEPEPKKRLHLDEVVVDQARTREVEQQKKKIMELQKRIEELMKEMQKKPTKETPKKTDQSSQAGKRPLPPAGAAQELLKQIELRDQLDKAQSDRKMWQERATWSERMSRPDREYVTVSQAEADQARLRTALLDEAKAALKVLRESRDAAAREKAAKLLEEALQKLVPTKQPDTRKR